MKIALTGGRDHHPSEAEMEEALALLSCPPWFGGEVLHGDCEGCDREMAERLRATWPSLKITPFPADWKKHGKAAGPIRNAEMIAQADMLIAFPGGKGTANCIALAEKKAIPVHRSIGSEPVKEEMEMTMTLKIKNEPGHYTATIKRMTRHTEPFEGPHHEAPLGELAPGEEMTVSAGKGAYLVIEEKPE